LFVECRLQVDSILEKDRFVDRFLAWSRVSTTERLIAEAQGLAYDVANMDREFARLYPDQYDASISGERMVQDARERWKHTLDGLHIAMRMQAAYRHAHAGAGVE